MRKKIGIAAMIGGVALAIWSAVVHVREAASIGIIGGADGPTAIFVTGNTAALWAGAGTILGVAALVIGMVLLRKRE